MRWFGENWGAPVCEMNQKGKTPVGKPCLRCKQPIEETSRGLSMLCYAAEPEPHWNVVHYHLQCMIDSVVPQHVQRAMARGEPPGPSSLSDD